MMENIFKAEHYHQIMVKAVNRCLVAKLCPTLETLLGGGVTLKEGT